jgi:microsomal dipeptidase-like Zn-dependent dipeptidase
MEKDIYADLHLHAHGRMMLEFYGRREQFKSEGKFHPWTITKSNVKKHERGRRGFTYTQADMVALGHGNVRIAFNALYPIEKGFFQVAREPIRQGKTFAGGMADLLVWVATNQGLPLRDLLQTFIHKMPMSSVVFFQSENYDYWEFLKDELNVLHEKNNTLTKPEPYRMERRAKKAKNKYFYQGDKNRYVIPNNRAHVQSLLAENSDSIVMPITIEGMHSLASDSINDSVLWKRIDAIKGVDASDDDDPDCTAWPYPVFFMTFSHHFDNKLCGHAHSVPGMTAGVFRQEVGMDEPFSERGFRAARQLPNINSQGEQSGQGKRILIDVKHMAAASRRDFYNQIYLPTEGKSGHFPIIASHCGYTGVKHLDSLVDDADRETDCWNTTGFNMWNINVCDEDVKWIFRSGGLIGVSLDQRILGVINKKKCEDRSQPDSYLSFWNNLKGMLDVICAAGAKDLNGVTYSLEDKKRAWKMFTIGSDFDGFVDPPNGIESARFYARTPGLNNISLRQKLIDTIWATKANQNVSCVNILENRAEVEQAVDGFCYGNAKRFLLEHYPE